MIGFPYYNDDVFDDKVYLSDHIVDNGEYIALGFTIALATWPTLAFADDNVCEWVPKPAPKPEPKVPTAVRDGLQGALAVAGCGAAMKQCGSVADQAVKAASEKLSNVNPPTAFAIAGCCILIGYCLGKVSTEGLDRMLGFK